MMAANSTSLNSEQAGEHAGIWKHSVVLFAAILLLSLAVRLAALVHWGTGAIDSEGTEYARIAQNLRNGTGYVGMTSPGLQIVFPPFFPLLIAAASFLTRDYEWAGRLVCLIFGSLLPLPVFGIASRLFNRTTGLVAAILTVFFPLLVNLSFAVLSEGVYITMLLLAVYTVFRTLERPSPGIYGLLGGIFGLCYLTRQEAVAPLLVALFLTICLGEGSLVSRSKWVAAALAVFAVVALPEVIYLYRATGQVRLEEKSSLFYAEQVRIAIGQENKEAMPVEWAEHSINANLERTGTANRSEADVVRETRVRFRQLARNLRTGVHQNLPTLLQQLSSRWLGAPFLTALAFLGALRRPWKRRVVAGYLYVVLVPLTAMVATFSFSGWTALRYYFVLVPFLLVWAANGLVGVGLWANACVATAGWRWIHPVTTKWIIPGLSALILIVYPLKGVRSLWNFQQDSRATQVDKESGLWIGQQQDRQVTIMDRYTPLAFYANAQWVDFPYSNGDLAVRFLDAAHVDYVVLRQGESYTSYYQQWLNNGIPDRRAERVHVASAPGGNQIIIFRWHGEGNP